MIVKCAEPATRRIATTLEGDIDRLGRLLSLLADATVSGPFDTF
jgi:hypothetical protein